jgi:PIN domain nuclease of toxin-antitoxin system
LKLLLDTHTFLWWDEGKLPAKVVRRIRAAETVEVSAASAWEVAIKAGLGKIAVHGSFADAVDDYGFRELTIRFAHAELVRTLPPLHRDPFDRMLVAQAIVEGLTIVTRDALVAAYAVPTLWE